jgi:hypothetical protein
LFINIRHIRYNILFFFIFKKDPLNVILLNINIVYTAEKIIKEIAIIPNKGSLSNILYKDINSPIKFKVRDTSQLSKDNIKTIQKIKALFELFLYKMQLI